MTIDKETKTNIREFFDNALSSVCKDEADFRQALRNLVDGARPSRLVNGFMFTFTKAQEQHSIETAASLCRILGSARGDEKVILDLLWSKAAECIDGQISSQQFLKDFERELKLVSEKSYRFIQQNDLVGLSDGLTRFALGPVEVVPGDLVARELNAPNKSQRWRVEVGDPGLNFSQGGTMTIGVPLNTWVITINAAKPNIEEEAAWLAGIFISFIKFFVPSGLVPFTGSVGVTEPHPFSKPGNASTAIIADEKGISTGVEKLPPMYLISPDVQKIFVENENVCSLAASVFYPGKNSVAERVRQGLGWLARGRQSHDRAERFLFFFTALETVLTSNDKTDPVTQTIARHCASIILNKVEERSKLASTVKKLYAKRSALIHSGARGVSKRDANTIESIAHRVCFQILDRADLGQKIHAFQADLLEASYGSPWRQDAAPRLPRMGYTSAEQKS